MKKRVIILITVLCVTAYGNDRRFFMHFPAGIFIPKSGQDYMKNRNDFMLGFDIQFFLNDYVGFALNRDIRTNSAGDVDFYTTFSGVGLSVKKSWENTDIYCNAGFAMVFSFINDNGRSCCGGDNFEDSYGVYADVGWRWFPTEHLYLGVASRYTYAGDIEYMNYQYSQSGITLMGVIGVGY